MRRLLADAHACQHPLRLDKSRGPLGLSMPVWTSCIAQDGGIQDRLLPKWARVPAECLCVGWSGHHRLQSSACAQILSSSLFWLFSSALSLAHCVIIIQLRVATGTRQPHLDACSLMHELTACRNRVHGPSYAAELGFCVLARLSWWMRGLRTMT